MAGDTYTKERELTEAIVPTVESALPDVEVLAVELLSPSRFCVYVDRPDGVVDFELCERGDAPARRLPRRLDGRRLVARARAPAAAAPALRGLRRVARSRSAPPPRWRARRGSAALSSPTDPGTVVVDGRRPGTHDPGRRDRPGQPDRRGRVGHEPGDHRRNPHDREGEGHRGGDARLRPRGCAARCVQEASRLGPPRRGRPRRRGRVPRVRDRDPRRPRGAAARRGDGEARSTSSRRSRPRRARSSTR